MARYFKFKSAAELVAESDRLGGSIEIAESPAALLEPAMVAGRPVGNRLAIQPMEGCDGELSGAPGELTYRRFERFGGGGAKLIWGEAAAVRDDGRANPRQLLLIEPHLATFARIVETTRSAHRREIGDDGDLLVGIQLTHSGRFSFSRPVGVVDCPVLNARPGAPANLPILSDDELERLKDDYVRAAGLAERAGFDFIDVKQCHRYLLSELLAAKTRPGRFGGSLENRASFVLDLLARIRAAHPGLILASRLNVFDGISHRKGADGRGEPMPHEGPFLTGFGTDSLDPRRPDLSEPIRLVGMLRESGLGLLNVSMGSPYLNPHLIRPAEYPPIDGYDPPEHPLVGVGRHFSLTAELQRTFPDLPMVGSGYSYLQEYLYGAAAANVAAGRTTFAGLGRSSLAYPQGPRDLARTGTLERKNLCRTFSYCTNLMRNKHHPLGQFPTGCPPFDKEVYHSIYEEAKRALAKSAGS